MDATASAPSQPPPPSPPAPPAKHIFILSGQSNMAGRGGVTRHHGWDGVVPPECRPDPSFLRLTAALRWEEAREPLHRDIDTRKTCGVGPGMAFANALRERGVGAGGAAVVVGLVPCAVGGTAIREWARGEHLYESMVRRARESVKDGGGGGEIKALLWYQGESDTSAEHDAEAYRGSMEALIKNVRGDLGLPSLPVIQVAIASGDGRYMDRVRRAQLEINLPNVVCVDAKGLPLKDDHLHLTTQAQVRLGRMLADAYLQHFAP
ncbi:probable carbohydrate esterase At4g34215 [Syzygium oleosum]|uniref:probable carbohydrate esterase At4g34215 n=1 Tax=Syzygium oleosum TaxID=219896 RepID=UPI0024BA750D|nr:probable carbohydrate esterase At4g34215 [Syzygium oleosum]